MLNKRLFVLPLVLCAVGVAFAIQGGPATPTTPAVAGSHGLPHFDRRDLDGGIQLATTVRFLENVIRPADGAIVRPLLIGMNFTYGFVLLWDQTYLALHSLSDTTPIEFEVGQMTRGLVVPQRPPLPPMSYHITLTPKAGFTWGTIRGAPDIEFVIVTI